MKRIFLFLLAAGMLLSMTACQPSNLDAADSGKGNSGMTDAGAVDVAVQYIRTNGYREGAEFPHVVIIRSPDELNTYYKENRNTFDLERKEKVYADTTVGFLDACDRYVSAFFEKSYLVFVLLEESSGSVRHEVTDCNYSDDSGLDVHIKTNTPEICTDDMAQWHLILELSREVNVQEVTKVRLWLDGRLAFGEGNSQIIGTKNPAGLNSPPAGKLLHGKGSTPLVAAGYSWNYPVGNGMMASAIVDHQHPLYCRDLLKPACVSGEYGKVVFEDDPDSITVRCWPDTAWNSSTVTGKDVRCNGLTFELKEGGFLYEITACWDKNDTGHFGSVSYLAYIIYGDEQERDKTTQAQDAEEAVAVYAVWKGETYSFTGDEAQTLKQILTELKYDPKNVCVCVPEYTMAMEPGGRYGIHLSEGYARCDRGQAELTAGQLDQIRSILQQVKAER